MRRMGGAFVVVGMMIALQIGLPAGARTGPMRVTPGRGSAAPSWVSGVTDGARSGSAVDAARAHLSANQARYHVDTGSLDLVEVIRDDDSSTVRFAQTYMGVPVFGAQYLVHQRVTDNGYTTSSVNGHYFTDLQTSVFPRIDGRSAARAARLYKHDVTISRVDNAGLTVLPGGPGRLVYNLTVWGSKDGGIPVKDRTFIDARSGALVLTYTELHADGPITGSGETSHGDVVPLNLLEQGGGFRFVDQTRSSFDPGTGSGVVEAFDAGGTDANLPSEESLVISPTQDVGPGATASGAVDAHYNAGLVFEYFKGLGRNSIDNQGMSVQSVVNAADLGGVPMYNAFWNGAWMTYGNPDPVHWHPFSAALDVVSHELTHGVTQFSGNLVYLDQSGAMNEAYSDYFGNAVEVDHEGVAMSDPEAGLLGEDLCKLPDPNGPFACPLRDLNDARTTDDFIFYLNTFDNGGVHLNSSIYSGALWNIREQLGGPAADDIVYKALTENTTPLDDFVDGRNAVVEAARTLHGDSAPEVTKVEQIFDTAEVVQGWDIPSSTDSTVLTENVMGLGQTISVPAASGNRFAFGSYDSPVDLCCVAESIYIGDVAGGPIRKMPGNKNAFNHELPDIDGKRVVWADVFFRQAGLDVDIVTGKVGGRGYKQVSKGSAIDWYPSVDGKRVAWERLGPQGTDIYTRVLGKPIKAVISDNGEQKAPSVSGDWVAWSDYGDGIESPSIHSRNMKTGSSAAIEFAPGAFVSTVSTNSTHMFWFADEDNDGTGGIFRATLGSSVVEPVVPDNVDSSPMWDPFLGSGRPSANDEFVAYTDASGFFGVAHGGDISDADAVGRDIWIAPVGGGTAVRVTSNRGDQSDPAMGNGRQVLWLDSVRGHTALMTRMVP